MNLVGVLNDSTNVIYITTESFISSHGLIGAAKANHYDGGVQLSAHANKNDKVGYWPAKSDKIVYMDMEISDVFEEATAA